MLSVKVCGTPRPSNRDTAAVFRKHDNDAAIIARISRALLKPDADIARVIHRPLSEAERVVELVGEVVNRFAPNGVEARRVHRVDKPSGEIPAVELVGHKGIVFFRPEEEHLAKLFRGTLDDSEESHEFGVIGCFLVLNSKNV